MMIKGIVIAAVVALGFAGSAGAATLPLEVSLTFDVVKVEHNCLRGAGGPPNPGPGNCGSYQELALGQTYAGAIRWSGLFEDLGGLYNPVGRISRSCTFGPYACQIGESSYFGLFSPHSIRWQPIIGDFDANFGFDLAAGTGWHTWTDDSEPYFGQGRFEFTNVVATGIPPIPVPASLPLLLAGAAGLGFISRRKRTSRGQASRGHMTA